MPRDPQQAAALNWQEVRADGQRRHTSTGSRSRRSRPTLAHGWQTKPSPKTGNPIYVRPSVLVHLPRGPRVPARQRDPEARRSRRDYDLILASQPWRARMSARVQGAEGARAARRAAWRPAAGCSPIQSYGRDPALEIVQRLWPDENPFKVDRHALLAALRAELGRDAATSTSTARPTTRRSSVTRCTRCRRRSATGSARRRCSPPGTPRST